MKGNLALIFLTLVSFHLFSRDYTSYHNLTEIAKKLMVGKQYSEASKVFDLVDKNYKSYFKSIDLYFWAISLAEIEDKKHAYEKLQLACKINDDDNIYGFLKYGQDDGVFDFLTLKEEEKLKSITKKYSKLSRLYNPNLKREFKYLDSIDNYWANYLVDTVWLYEESSPKYNKYNKLHKKNVFENNTNLVDLILEKGYPSYQQIKFPITHLLYHLDSYNFTRIEPILKEALKEGKIAPFDFAYTFYRATGEDRYNFQSFIELKIHGETPKEKIFIEEKMKIGLGI